jgi:intracellular septation protein
LVIFLAAYELKGLLAATAALMAATVAALVLSLAVDRRLPIVPLVTAVIVGVFGGLTLWLNDETFIKLKPTILYALFAAVIAGGLATGRLVLKAVLGEALPLDDLGWRRLSKRFVFFFLAMAATNEVVRRLLSTDLWVLWKVGGSIVFTILFLATQLPLIRRHHHAPDEAGK